MQYPAFLTATDELGTAKILTNPNASPGDQQAGIKYSEKQEEATTYYGNQVEKVWNDENRREGIETNAGTNTTVEGWRLYNNVTSNPSVFNTQEANKVENAEPFCGTGLCLAAGYAVGNILAGLIGYGGTKAAIKTADKINESATGEKGAIDNEKVNHDVNSAFTAIGALKAGEATFVGGVGTGSYFVSNYYSLSTLLPATAEFTESALPSSAPYPSIPGATGYIVGRLIQDEIENYKILPKLKEGINNIKNTFEEYK